MLNTLDEYSCEREETAENHPRYMIVQILTIVGYG